MNIFEGITKEKFIEEFNKEGNGSLSLLHINLAFDYKTLKKKKINNGVALISITNITNYLEEIEIFNSFKPFMEFQGKPALLVGNYIKYLLNRNKLDNKLVYYEHKNVVEVEKLYIFDSSYYTNSFNANSYTNYKAFNSISAFNKAVNDENLKKSRDSLVIELTNLEREQKDKILSHLNYCFLNFTDRGCKIGFDIEFPRIESLKRGITLTNKDLIGNNFFDKFIVSIYDEKDKLIRRLLDSEYSIKIDDYLKISTEILENIQDVAEYLDCNIEVFDLLKFSFMKK